MLWRVPKSKSWQLCILSFYRLHYLVRHNEQKTAATSQRRQNGWRQSVNLAWQKPRPVKKLKQNRPHFLNLTVQNKIVIYFKSYKLSSRIIHALLNMFNKIFLHVTFHLRRQFWMWRLSTSNSSIASCKPSGEFSKITPE